MGNIGQVERITQNRVIALFRDRLKYDYAGNWEERENNSNIEEKYLRGFLVRSGYNPKIIDKAINKFKRIANNQKSLYEINREIYGLLRYGVKVKEDVGENYQTVWLIDWDKPENNHFAIAEEVTIHGRRTKRPDIVLYVNGIALGVLELKRSTISVFEGIRQNIGNQKDEFIKDFFATIQFVMAGNETEGMRYGTIEAKETYYWKWKESGFENENRLDKHLLQLCNKERFLEIIHDFIVFDAGIKKICRHNQYFAVKAAQSYTRRHEGGIIWHTQGSGKSLTMVWIAKWIRENMEDSRVLILTDRIELDEQIEKVFMGVNERILRTKKSKDLVEELNKKDNWLLCSLIHKFGRTIETSESYIDRYIEEMKRVLPADFEPKGDLFVFVDECHRSHSGKLHKAMKKILVGATFIGFTGTPLLKKDKNTSVKVFGPYIHTYKYDEAVTDKVVLDLRYEARRVPQRITSQSKIDEWFEEKTRGLNDFAIAMLKKRWGTMQSLLSSGSRLEKIVFNIIDDFEKKARLASGRGNAMLVANSIHEACQYYEIFQKYGFTKCAVITSYEPGALNTEEPEYRTYRKMLNGNTPERFEEETKEKFIKEPGQMSLLIVVNKLLTGFDAPPATYLYIDKTMQDHGLFQAVCRVNRLDTEDKEYGYIIDYRDLFKKLEKAVTDYTSGAFEGFDKEDIVGVLKDRLKEGKKDLDESLETTRAICESVEPPKDSAAYIRYFCGDVENPYALKETELRRIKLYKAVSHLLRSYADIAGEMEEAGYSREEANKIVREVKYYEQVKAEVKLASGDYIDLKKYERDMRILIDRYVNAEESRKLFGLEDIGIIELLVNKGENFVDELPESVKKSKNSVAEIIENNVRRLIIDEMPVNPEYYQRMSYILEDLIKRRRQEDIEYEEYLKQIAILAKQTKHPEESTYYPVSINTKAKRALYDNLGQDEKKANLVHDRVSGYCPDGFRGNLIKERKIKIEIKKLLPDSSDEKVNKLLEIIKNQDEY